MSVMVAYALKQVGKPYKLGTRGPDKFDCSGLTLQAAAQIGLNFYHGATTQWLRGRQQKEPANMYGYFKETGPISNLPMDKVAFLFNRDNTASRLVMAHTGLYDGHGWVVQAGGYGGRGVHFNKIDKRRWSDYALLLDTWMELDGADDMNNDYILLRRGSFGQEVRVLQEVLLKAGYDVGKWKADGKFGAATERALKAFQNDMGIIPDGIAGPKTWALLKKESGEEGSNTNKDEAMVKVPLRLLEELMTYMYG